jgi:hypothetical protein
MGVSGQRHAPAALYPRERIPGTHCTGGWVGPRAGLDTKDRRNILLPLPGIEPRSPGHPVRSQTPYWLSYPGSSSLCKAEIHIMNLKLIKRKVICCRATAETVPRDSYNWIQDIPGICSIAVQPSTVSQTKTLVRHEYRHDWVKMCITVFQEAFVHFG